MTSAWVVALGKEGREQTRDVPAVVAEECVHVAIFTAVLVPWKNSFSTKISPTLE